MDQKTNQNNKGYNTQNVATQASLQCSPSQQQTAVANVGPDDERSYETCTEKLTILQLTLPELLVPATASSQAKG